ncbi:MAG: glycogen debranching enzyme GlgX, partial [Planctomycetia bacterium]|nr:glycogen debranching enzyme GlgX [Planctomycetia bacterium]
EFATRLCGSADLYEWSGRRPYASINFVTCHDGFVLEDLVSYNEKHNEANGEENRDGNNENLSWNCDAEGPTDDPAIRALRQQQKRNFIATLFLSQGVPMLLAGDELSHTQHGNNNAYCQDNEISWLNWDLDDEKKEFLQFVCRMVQWQHQQPVLRRKKFFQGRPLRGSDIKDVAWFDPTGEEMNDVDWSAGFAKTLAVRLAGNAIDETDGKGERIVGDTLLVLFNAHHEEISFVLPEAQNAQPWELVLDTRSPSPPAASVAPRANYAMAGRTLALFRSPAET